MKLIHHTKRHLQEKRRKQRKRQLEEKIEDGPPHKILVASQHHDQSSKHNRSHDDSDGCEREKMDVDGDTPEKKKKKGKRGGRRVKEAKMRDQQRNIFDYGSTNVSDNWSHIVQGGEKWE